MTDSPEALTIPETCVAARIGRTKVYDAINQGLLVARKFGTRTLVLRCDLLKFLAALPSATETKGKSGPGCGARTALPPNGRPKSADDYEVLLASGTACPHCARMLRASDVIIDLGVILVCGNCHRDVLVIRWVE